MDGGYDSFYGAAAVYADVLGEQGLAEYRRLATNAWDKLPRPSRKTRTRDEFDSARTCLKRILDFFAERDGDVPARIALRTADLSSAWNYLELAQFCLDQRLKDDALRWAEEGLWMFEDDRPDERLVFFAADILAGAGRKGDAEKHLWQAFEKAPSLELYARLRKLGKTAARDRAVKILEDRLVAKTRTPWSGGASLLIAILMREKRFDAAWAAVATHGASIDVRQDLASQSEATHPRHALEVYAECVDQFAVVGGNPAYEKAAQLVAHMAKLRSRDEQTAYVLALKVRFERRRNFIKLLK
jgi:tetratricopeptide (TPR) repeat protein